MRSLLVLALGALLLPSCSKNADKPEPPGPRGAPPPPSAEAKAKPDTCKKASEVKDAVSAPFFPPAVGAFCVNPEGETHAFGDKAQGPVDGLCKMIDGGCDLYLKHQAKRVVVFDYVDGAGTGATVNTTLTQFASTEHAYAMFTLRIVGEDDPQRPDMPKKIDVGAPAATGTGSLYVFKGPYLLELSYVNSEESGDEKKLRASADKILPQVARAIAAKLPGGASPPPAAALLPADNQIPLGALYSLNKTLGVEGTGHGAQGFYRDGDRRYRVVAISKDDPDQAKDVLKTFGKIKGSAEEKNLGEGAIRLMLQEQKDDPKAEWVIARKGKALIGVGDDAFALRGGDPTKVSLTKEDKIKRLKSILDASK